MTHDTFTESKLGEVEALLSQRLSRRVRNLRLLVRDGGVVLQGLASSYYVKQLAQHAAMGILGLPLLANEIEVDLAPDLPHRPGGAPAR